MLRIRRKLKLFSIILIGLICNVIQAQELPPLQNFSPQEYAAGDQNWSIAQSEDRAIYIANNAGLLEYNGERWNLYKSPNQTIIRSVTIIGDKIYTGGYMDFGHWERNQYGDLVYTSISKTIDISLIEDEEFWSIIGIEEYVLFQSFERIYMLNTKDNSLTTIDTDTRINKIFKVDESIYFQNNEKGIYKIQGGKAVLVIPSVDFQNREIIGVYNEGTSLLILTNKDGFYTFINDKLIKWDVSANPLLNNVTIYSSIKLKDGGFLLGTIANGIIQISDSGNVMLTINQSSGLSNNTVLALKEDDAGNIWLGLDNGIDVVNLNSPYKVYEDKQGILGTVYAAAKTDTYIYLGTNQGLFYRELSTNSKFKFIEGTNGQVWSLSYIKNTLFCGHDNGTYVVNGHTAHKITNQKGTWVIKEIANYPNLLIQGNYKGLSVLEKINDKWIYRNKISGFDISSRFLEIYDTNEIFINHEYKGVYKLKIDEEFNEVLIASKLTIGSGINSSIASYKDELIYCNNEGVFIYNEDSLLFRRDSTLSNIFSGNKYLSGKLINDQNGRRLWGFPKDEIVYLEPSKLSDDLEVNSIPIPSEIQNLKVGFENILYLDDNSYLVGTTEGYLMIDTKKSEQLSQEIYLNRVGYSTLHNESTPLVLDSFAELKNKNNNIHFDFSVTNFGKFNITKYQYRLKGLYDNWSDWSSNSEVYFENLPPGDYTFEARAKINGNLSENIISYSFYILKPWYASAWAMFIYVLLFIGLAFFIQLLDRRYYRKKKQKLIDKKERELEIKELESQRQIMEFKNENLRQDIDNKNRELGMSTMNLINKNELLNSIKRELSKAKKIEDINSVVKLINKNLNTTDDWKLFEEAFNNADKDFLKKVKSKHPSLTSNDLRLCAYLKLNLSSKEIAPLLNISHKSVEVKRYRLRKKMKLNHKQSLSNYILDI